MDHEPTVPCERCGHLIRIGESPFCRDNHAPVRGSAQYVQFEQLFSNYYDEGLDVEVTGRQQRQRVMRDLKADFRERPSPGERSARRDKAHERRKEQSRA